MKIAIIGTYPPRQCGIATFSHDLYHSLPRSLANDHHIFAVSDGSEYVFPEEVTYIVEKENLDSYIQAADVINNAFDACIIQHEYGIFGGETGSYIIDLLQHLNVPILTNLHTVLEHPHHNEYRILRELAQYSSKITVMTSRAINMLETIYQIDRSQVSLIPHGVPNFDCDQEMAKRKLGFQNKKVMLSFGFLGKSKGFETAIQAVSEIENDDFVYIILGSTHPNVLKHEGDAYRHDLMDMVMARNIGHKVQFVNQFASEKLLKEYLSACDIYVTPYPNENQISSGTLSFALGAGAACISTPYWYAKDLLADDRGLFFPFNDAHALSSVVNDLLDQPEKMHYYRNNALEYGKQMSWANVGKKQFQLLNELCTASKTSTICFNDTVQQNNITNIFHSNKRLSS
ncbi:MULTISPECIES: glycosyltransferase family 4 protein [Sphingobacterium]|uniref:glycosyltransferase family 4 protein n=1 Tax=Sphingobacterium TaxID=28453 RepID=UPI001049D065|nr:MULTISPECIES: glycosyltransferase family 4 protein [Sphingobacterium]MCW2263775.1 glycosyltransferase involved in cell wall biosynthesis [Sphingobacterium kitahiroshimense]NJI73484.1 glycosyltransferase [Sphingobacterium sp. B16(2022)]TCR00653.1 glycosyltransferase involved in cell wall biosynthesis [Sphingobacterium sp. JUb78]